jgi:FixJ family two-component response regulator
MRRHNALVIHDDPRIVDELSEIFASLDHTYQWAHSQEEARRLLLANDYSYVILDLEIPARPKRGQPRIRNGINLLEDLRGDGRLRNLPVIVVAGQGVITLRLAVWLMKQGAADILEKPLLAEGYTLDRAIKKSVADPDTARRQAAVPQPQIRAVPAQFQGGDLVFYPDHVELCGVKVLGGTGAGQTRHILEELNKSDGKGGFVARSGERLAKAVEADGGQNAVAGCIRHFRRSVTKAMRQKGIICGSYDVIQSRGGGYRLASTIEVRAVPGVSQEPALTASVP